MQFAQRLLVLLFLFVAHNSAVAQPAQPGGSAEEASVEQATSEDAEKNRPLPPIEEEVHGTCLTARQAYLQILHWAKTDPRKAALCFDTSGLEEPGKEAPRLAVRMLEFLDAEAKFIEVDKAPTSNTYVDERSGQYEYYDPSAPEFRIRRADDGRWLFTPESLDRIPESSFAKDLASRLPDWFHTRMMGNELWKYFGIFVLILLSLLVQRTVVFFIQTYLATLVSKSKLHYLHKAVDKADRPIGGLLMSLVLHFGVPQLALSIGLSQVAAVAIKFLTMFSVVWLAYRLIDVLQLWMESKADMSETKLDDQLVPLLTKSLKVMVSILGGIFVLQNLNVDVGSLLAGVGLGGLAFALAAKDTIANFFGSVMIFIDKPFQIGDWIVVGNVEGTVEAVGFRTTRVRTFYNSLVTVPNASITTTSVDNYGLREYRRYNTTLGLCYDTPVEKIEAFCEGLRAVISAMPGMRKDYYLVEFHGFGDSSLKILVYCFMVADNWNEELRIRTHLNLEIMRLAGTLGVGFAFPTQTLHVETLAQLGESRPSHSGPSGDRELDQVVDGFADGGEHLVLPDPKRDVRYDCGPQWKEKRWPRAE